MCDINSMTFILLFLIFAILQSFASGLLTCHQVNVDECMRSFKKDFDAGIEPLKTANETTAALICWRYHVVSKCIVPIVFYCPEIQDQMQKKLEQFEYFCANYPKMSSDGWPFKPTFRPDETDQLIEDADAEKERKKVLDSAFKACLAAGITVLLILICVIADCISRLKVWLRVRRAVAVSNAIQEEQLLQKEELEKHDDDDTEASPKKV